VFARPETVVAVVLWIAHTHAVEAAEATPYLAITSPEKQSGKTRLLECLALLAKGDARLLITPTASTLFRTLEASPEASLLIDELDAVFKDRSDRYEEVRAIINAGHRRGATVPRAVPGPNRSWMVKHFPVFGPKALAGIGKLPDTIADRSIPVRMVKRLSSEIVVRFRARTAAGEASPIVEALAAALAAQPPSAEADAPRELVDRAADGWEPLLAIADAAGDPWPARARRAASALHAVGYQDESTGLRLLADIRLVFETRGEERISTADLIAALKTDDEGPWVDERSPLTPHRLARLLRPYEIESKQMRVGSLNCKGYQRSSFLDTWARWLPGAQAPPESQHRNTEPEQSFGVSDPATPDGHAAREPGRPSGEEPSLAVDWDAVFADDPGYDTWADSELPERAGGRLP
jgi:hypothetical protein